MNDKRYTQYNTSWFKSEHSDKAIILMLIFLFPLGLYLMWTKECTWKMWIKGAVSAFIAVLLIVVICVLLPALPNAELEGNVEIVQKTEISGRFAPFKPEGMPDTAQLLKLAGEKSSLISTPTATPQPIWVYSNDNGLYYHLKECRYVYETTPRVTLRQALEGGKKACDLCNPPDEL